MVPPQSGQFESEWEWSTTGDAVAAEISAGAFWSKRKQSGKSIARCRLAPVAVVCPQCGARAGKACKMSRRDLAESHIERLVAAATKDIAARRELGKSTQYAGSRSAS
jgi:hypothetical protein